MTDLEKNVADALRLSTSASMMLSTEISRNIAVAKAELQRSGVSTTYLDETDPLGNQAIITYCLMQMNDEEKAAMYLTSFQYQQDNLRKSR